MNPNESKTRSSSREEKGRRLYLAGYVKLSNFPIHDILRKLRLGSHVFIPSESDPSREYAVNGRCECHDYLRHADANPKHMCKHRWALKIALDMDAYIDMVCDQVADPDYIPPRKEPRRPTGRGVTAYDIDDMNALWHLENCGKHDAVVVEGGWPIRIPVEHQ